VATILPPEVTLILERAAALSADDISKLARTGPSLGNALGDAYLAARELAVPEDLAIIDAFVNAAHDLHWGEFTVEERSQYMDAVRLAGDAALAVLVRDVLPASAFDVLYAPWRRLD
jgi:hypothetical protein